MASTVRCDVCGKEYLETAGQGILRLAQPVEISRYGVPVDLCNAVCRRTYLARIDATELKQLEELVTQ